MKLHLLRIALWNLLFLENNVTMVTPGLVYAEICMPEASTDIRLTTCKRLELKLFL